MKLTSEPKPVRIRIVSGGEEHSSLDSLRHNFCLPDLQKIEKQLIQWLNRQGEEGQDIAQELQAMPTKLSNCSSLEDFFVVYKILFKDIIPLSNVDSLGKLYEWFGNNQNRFSKNLVSLHGILWGVDEKYTISVIEKEDRITEETADILNRFNSARAHFLLGQYYYEKKEFAQGRIFIEKAANEGDKDAALFLSRINTSGWEGIDVNYMKSYIDYKLKKQPYGCFSIESEKEHKMKEFIDNCILLTENEYIFAAEVYDDALKYFGTKDKGNNNIYSINDGFLFEQKLFVINVIGLCVDEMKADSILSLEKQAKRYYPAKYLTDNKERHPFFDMHNFRGRRYRNMIKILLQNLFEF